MEKKTQVLKLLEKNKEKYPNLTNLWKNYINNQYNILLASLTHCENLFNNIDNITDRDMDMNSIATLYILKKIMDEEN